MAGLQQLEHFVEQAALWHVGQQRVRRGQRCQRLGVKTETQTTELGRETHGADDAHRVFAVARGGITNHAQCFLLRITNTVVKVHHDLRGGVVVHGIDGEVAPRGIVLDGAPDVVAQHPPAGVHRMLHARELALAGAFVAADLLGVGAVEVSAEGRDFNHFVLTAATIDHVHDAKTPPDDEGAAKQVLDLLGRGVGGHVKVFRAQAEQQIAHRTADDIGLETRLLQGVHHVQGALIHQLGVDAMHAGGHVFALAKFARGFAAGLSQQLVKECLDHAKRFRMRQPRSLAMAVSRSSGLVATGSCTLSSSGKSLMESL